MRQKTVEKSKTRSRPVVERDHGLHLLQEMIRIRRLEEKCYELYSAAKIRGFMHLYDGEEAVAVGVMQALTPEDAIIGTYREHGHALARGVAAGAILAEMFGKQEGCARGRGGSMHLFDKETRFYGGNAIVGSHLPLAVGMGLADKLRGLNRVNVCFFGDGAVAEGEFHESLNLAALWQAPVLFICENNQFCMGTSIKFHQSEPEIWKKAASYHIPAKRVDGMDVLAVEAATREAVAKIKAGEGPQFLECLTYRFRAHSMFDAELYRDKGEVQEWRQRDPILLFTELLKGAGLISDEDIEEIEREVKAEIASAVDLRRERHLGTGGGLDALCLLRDRGAGSGLSTRPPSAAVRRNPRAHLPRGHARSHDGSHAPRSRASSSWARMWAPTAAVLP